MQQFSDADIFHACRVLFGSDLNLNHEFLSYLQPSGVRTAYRKKALVTHPDRFVSSSSQTRARQEKLFQNLNQAYEVVQSYLKQRKPVPLNRQTPGNKKPYSRPYTHRQAQKPQRFYQGPLPARPLQFGQFLYYRSLIPYTAVISAITWQRQQRPAMGEIARRWRWLNEQDVEQILKLRGGLSRFGERAEKLGLLNPLQVRTLLVFQRNQQEQIGRYFINHDFISEHNLDRLLRELSEHNLKYRHGFSGQFYTQS